jgi:tRNA-dihydrouridine synthase A
MAHPAEHRFCVAPMIDWTDRYCRYFHRQLTRHARLYTEMVVDDAILHGDRDRLLGFDPVEHPVALQIGGSEPDRLAAAARIGAAYGYDEINLNVGCPSDRVQSGRFGACLMREPDRVADAVAAMREAVTVPVTVKCRIGVDDQDPREVLPDFLSRISDAGCRVVIIHARKAWLQGLSPKENRTIPPLDYGLAREMVTAFPDLAIVLNGGITSLAEAKSHLQSFAGVMLGREAYGAPALLGQVDRELFAGGSIVPPVQAVDAVAAYCEQTGTPVWRFARHMLGLYAGRPGARHWRRVLSAEGRGPHASPDWLRQCAAELEDRAEIAL